MIIEPKSISGKELAWTLRCPTIQDAVQLSDIRVKIDGETENLDREPGEHFLSAEDFEQIIVDDSKAERSLFLVAEADGKIVGFARCVGNELKRFKHKADFGICISKEYWGHGIGRLMLKDILIWADSAGIEKIALSVVETNEKAIKLYKSFDFIEEGRLIKDRVHQDGNFYNTVIMSRLKTK